MVNIIFKTIFQILILVISLFFLSFLIGIISVNDIIFLFNLDPESNGGKAITKIFSELKIVTNNLFGIIFG